MAVDEAVDVVLHIGADKTGTTTIQQLFRHNRRALAERGILYPRSPGKVRHAGLSLYARPDEVLLASRDWRRGDSTDPAVFRRRLRRRLRREVVQSGASSMVLSDEALYRMAAVSITRLRGLVTPSARRLRVVFYVRRQDDHLVSRYQQAVKVGQVQPLDVWALRDYRNMYDFAGRIATWRDALQPTDVVVRPFERSRFHKGSLVEDFADASGIDLRVDDLRPIEVRNESLGVEGVEMLRILNLHRIQNLGLETWQISNRAHVRMLRETTTGPQVTLPEADLDRFMAQWEASNRQVAIDHLGDPTGELFGEPRKTAGTTVEQVLDPTRLGHYLELLEIPEQEREPIRRIAELEASRSSAH